MRGLPFVLVLLFGVACAGQAQEEPIPTGTIGQLELRVEAPAIARSGEVIDLRLIVTNPADSAVELVSSRPGGVPQFTASDANGYAVWHYDTVPDVISHPWTIAPHSEVSFDGEWRGLLDRSGSTVWLPVPPGDYTVTGRLITTIPWGGSPGTAPVPITILPAE